MLSSALSSFHAPEPPYATEEEASKSRTTCLQMRHNLNLHIRLQWQLMHRNTRPGGLLVAEPFRILPIHSGEVVHGGQVDGDFDDVVDGGAGLG